MQYLVPLFVALSLAFASSARAEELPTGPIPYATLVAQEQTSSSGVLSQADPRWSGERLGGGTVRSQGCLFIAIAMVAIERGLASDPVQLLRRFLVKGLFTRSGRLQTNRIGEALPGLAVVERTATGLDAPVRIADRLDRRQAVFLKLDRDLRRAGTQQHWVRVLDADGVDVTVADPNGGKTGTLLAIYGSNAVMQEMLVLG